MVGVGRSVKIGGSSVAVPGGDALKDAEVGVALYPPGMWSSEPVLSCVIIAGRG